MTKEQFDRLKGIASLPDTIVNVEGFKILELMEIGESLQQQVKEQVAIIEKQKEETKELIEILKLVDNYFGECKHPVAVKVKQTLNEINL